MDSNERWLKNLENPTSEENEKLIPTNAYTSNKTGQVFDLDNKTRGKMG
jgi:hypothetical protein